MTVPQGRLAASVLLAAFGLLGCPSPEKPPQPPTAEHLILVVFDTLRADRLSLYDHSVETTPFLDSIASELVVYGAAKAPAPWTVPSHASLFTGLWPSEHRAQWGSLALDDRFETLAETLSAHGFLTSALSANLMLAKGTGLQQGFGVFEQFRQKAAAKTPAILDRLPRLLDQADEEDTRVFVFLNFMDTHLPYHLRSKPRKAVGLIGPAPIRTATAKWRASAGLRSLTDDEVNRQRRAYDAAVLYVDRVAQTVIEQLRDRGILDQSLVVFTSDHGDGLGYHREWGHSISVWEEQLAVPLVVRFPQGWNGGQVVEGPRSLVSVMPSLLDWLAVARPAALEGRPALNDADQPVLADYRSYFSEPNRGVNQRMSETYPGLAGEVQHRHAIYCDGYKLILQADAEPSLYDLNRDPDEQVDLASEKSEALRSCVRRYREEADAGRLTPFDSGPPDWGTSPNPDLEDLRALGYIE